MAGDWVKMRAGLATCPKVAAISRSVCAAGSAYAALPRHAMRLMVIGGLHSIWCAVNEHTTDGIMRNAVPEDIDEIAGIDGIGLAMRDAGWLTVNERTHELVFPNFHQWNTCGKDATAAERMRKHREKQAVTRNNRNVTRNGYENVALDKTRQDKSKEEPAAQVATSEPPKRRTRSQPASSVSWSADAGWQGITDADRQEWRTAYPACDLTAELAKAASWLKGNPAKAHRSNWRRFLVSWLTRSQDRGGTNRTPNARLPVQAPAKSWSERPSFRGEFQQSMTDAEYARAKSGKHGMVAALAESISLKEKG